MTEPALREEIDQVRAGAECLADRATIDQACDRMATEITHNLSRSQPLILGVMTGGMVPLAMLLQRLEFPLQVDYAHLTRYGMQTSGGDIRWIRRPPEAVRDRVVLVVDDLLDHGVTLQTISAACLEAGASEVQTAVLVTKEMDHREGLQSTTYSALTLPDRYLFGYGMDYKSWLRNADGIYAVAENS